jgi:hypothetical protein
LAKGELLNKENIEEKFRQAEKKLWVAIRKIYSKHDEYATKELGTIGKNKKFLNEGKFQAGIL